jgi:hypothetical protein
MRNPASHEQMAQSLASFMITSARNLTMIVALTVANMLVFPAQATVYLSNSDFSNEGSYGVNGSYWMGQKFQTGGSVGGYTLSSISLRMNWAEPVVQGFQLAVYNDSGGLPGTTVEVLTGDNNPVPAGLYTYASSGTHLNESTTYWIVASAASSSGLFANYFWDFTHSPTYLSVDGWQIATGSSAALYDVSANQWKPYPFDPNARMKFAVEGAPVPEPGTLALIGLALGAFGRARSNSVARSRRRL